MVPKLLMALVATLLVAVVWALDNPPSALISVLLPVSLVAAGYAVAAANRSEQREAILRAGLHVLGLLFILTLATFRSSYDDWVHMLWSVEYPLCGLFLGAGLLLVQVWPEDRRQHPDLLKGWNGATVALLALLVLGAIPVLLSLLPIDTRSAGRVSGSPLPALVEVVRYGFDGKLPALMEPEGTAQVARGLGAPPRWVTVPMGSTLLAAGTWILFVALALVGRAIPVGISRRSFFALTPLVSVPAAMFLGPARAWNLGIWKNEPWLVQAYGPTLLIAAVATVVLFVAVWRGDRRE